MPHVRWYSKAFHSRRWESHLVSHHLELLTYDSIVSLVKTKVLQDRTSSKSSALMTLNLSEHAWLPMETMRICASTLKPSSTSVLMVHSEKWTQLAQATSFTEYLKHSKLYLAWSTKGALEFERFVADCRNLKEQIRTSFKTGAVTLASQASKQLRSRKNS